MYYALACLLLWHHRAQASQRLVDAPSVPSLRVWPSQMPEGCPLEPSQTWTRIGFTGRHREYTQADTWYPSWGQDGRLYSPFTDGMVGQVSAWSFGDNPRVGCAIIEGSDPMHLQVVEAGLIQPAPAPYEGRYPCGSLMHNGVWYIGTYGLANAPYGLNWPILGPCAGFHVSTDLGKTWQASPRSCDPSNALFPEPDAFKEPVKFGAPHFVDFGRNMEHAPDGRAYLIGHGSLEKDLEDRRANLSWITGDQIYLCRVTPSPATINDANAYEYFAGHDSRGEPISTRDFKQTRPLLEWDNHTGCVTVTYNAPLNKYLMCVTDGGTTMSKFHTYILEADALTGPWRMVAFMRDFGQQAYFVNIPSRFIGADGRTFWLCYSANFTNGYAGTRWWSRPAGSNYHMCLQEASILGPDDPAPEDPLGSLQNVARSADVRTSSTHPGYQDGALTDGVVGGYPSDPNVEWASRAERQTAMVRLSWETPQTVDRIWLFDRPNDLDQVQAGWLVFSDGTTTQVGPLPDDGRQGREITFARKTVDWLAFIITEVKPSTVNIGLSEIAVFSAAD